MFGGQQVEVSKTVRRKMVRKEFNEDINVGKRLSMACLWNVGRTAWDLSCPVRSMNLWAL